MQNVIDFIKNNDRFIVTSHVAPDGDNIGSSIAMTKFLNNIGKSAYHFLDDNTPNALNFITDRVKIYKSEEFESVIGKNKYSVIILDCGNKPRVNVQQSIIDNAENTICIDHHESNDFFCNANYVVVEASSTCELVYNVIKTYDEKNICELTATALYTGLTTDTGHFKFDCTAISSFLMAADLLSRGAKKQEVIKNIYQSDDYNYKKMEADLIVNHMEKMNDICVMTLSQDILKKHGVDIKDIENLVNNTVNITGVEVGLLVKEKSKGLIKASLRSKERINVAKIAESFGGGGHERAAGLTIKNATLDEARKMILKKIKENM